MTRDGYAVICTNCSHAIWKVVQNENSELVELEYLCEKCAFPGDRDTVLALNPYNSSAFAYIDLVSSHIFCVRCRKEDRKYAFRDLYRRGSIVGWYFVLIKGKYDEGGDVYFDAVFCGRCFDKPDLASWLKANNSLIEVEILDEQYVCGPRCCS